MGVWIIVSDLPELFRRSSRHLLQGQSSDPSEIMDLMLRCYNLRHNIMLWIQDYNAKRMRQQAADVYSDRGNLGGAMAAQCMVQRLLVTLQPRGVESIELESSTQELAEELVTFAEGGDMPQFLCMDLILAQKRVIANAVLATRDAWMNALESRPRSNHGGRSHIDPQLFKDYCGRLGRSSALD